MTDLNKPPTGEPVEPVEEEILDPSEPTRQYVRRALSRIVRRMAAVIIVMTFITGLGLYLAEQAGDEAGDAAEDATAAAQAATQVAEAVEQESIERQVSACRSTNEFRARYREDLARRAEGAPTAEITATPEYRALPDNVRPFVDFLIASAEASGASAAQLLEAYTENFPIVDCDALEERLERESVERRALAVEEEEEREIEQGGG